LSNNEPHDEDGFPVASPSPPDSGWRWLSSVSNAWKKAIATGEFTAALGCIIAGWTLGGDLILTAIALAIGWLVACVGFATLPESSKPHTAVGIVLAAALFGGEYIFLDHHFHRGAPASVQLDNQANPPTIDGEFARARVPLLGSSIGKIEVTNGMYQASHERAMVFSLLPVQTVFALPKDSNRPAIAYHYVAIDDDKKWWDDKFLRDKFKVPKDKKPPEYTIAELWDQTPDKLKWIGWREWSCSFTTEKFYYQKFEHGIIFGVVPTSETLGSSQIITVLDGGKWSGIEPEDKVGGIAAPACNENTARVNGVVIHGHHVKPRT
jgi:hypothetical protein